MLTFAIRSIREYTTNRFHSGPRAQLLGWRGEKTMWNNETGICINRNKGKKLNKDKG